MAASRFEWDHRKDAENQRKHRIAFEEARTVFADEYALLLDDPDHSGDEDRFILLGLSAAFRVLVVVHTYRAHDDIIRIIRHGRRPRSSASNTTRGGIDETRI